MVARNKKARAGKRGVAVTASVYRYLKKVAGQRGGSREKLAEGTIAGLRGFERVKAGEFGAGSFRVEYRDAFNALVRVDSHKVVEGMRMSRAALGLPRTPRKPTAPRSVPSAGTSVVFTPSEHPLSDVAAQWSESRERVDQRVQAIRNLCGRLSESVVTIQIVLEKRAMSELLNVAVDPADIEQRLSHLSTDLDALRSLASGDMATSSTGPSAAAAG